MCVCTIVYTCKWIVSSKKLSENSINITMESVSLRKTYTHKSCDIHNNIFLNFPILTIFNYFVKFLRSANNHVAGATIIFTVRQFLGSIHLPRSPLQEMVWLECVIIKSVIISLCKRYWSNVMSYTVAHANVYNKHCAAAI